jgi:SAM-dependent methyltransferase/uncharacterized membrane protein YbhN (UPF0104 family)
MFRRLSKRSLGLLLFLGVVGSISTAFWIGSVRLVHPRLSVLPALLGLALCLALTSLNLAARWLRWHFLVRRYTRSIATRDSLAVYLATLPAIITPFFIGELVRVLILRKQSGAKAAPLVWVWLIERILDSVVLLWFLVLALDVTLGLALLPILVGIGFLLFRLLLEDRRARHVLTTCSLALTATIVAWILPALALLAILGLYSQVVPFAVGMRAFAAGTLFGGISGLPLGVSITGSTMIKELVAAGVAPDVGVLAILVHRIGTAWYAVFLGVAAFVFWRRRLANILRGGAPGHFDEIAHEYEEQIPKHVRDQLLAKKIGLIEGQLAKLAIDHPGVRPGVGLDVGCGQGWYLGALARAGHRMIGIDFSGGQLTKAAANLRQENLDPAILLRADAQVLPFADGTFDFAYSINAFHHLPSAEAQAKALREIGRVLRPGGTFVLHEINTQNPVFRLYVGYLFPLLKQIDEGIEKWILPSRLPVTAGATWQPDIAYFTFTPDFVPSAIQRALNRVERFLERSAFRRYSAHYQACLVKDNTENKEHP